MFNLAFSQIEIIIKFLKNFACFTVASQKGKVEVSHAKISRNFSHHKNASAEPHNYPLNLFFTVHKNLVFF